MLFYSTSEELAFSFVDELGMSADDSGVGADVLGVDGVVSSKGDIVAQGDNGVVMVVTLN